jgi:hypothetical protein
MNPAYVMPTQLSFGRTFVGTTTTHSRAKCVATVLLSSPLHPFMSASGSVRMVNWPGIEAFQPTNYTPVGLSAPSAWPHGPRYVRSTSNLVQPD